MNLDKEVKKLMEVGYEDSEKDKEKMLEVLLFYAETHDMKINYARQQYERMFNLSYREAEELNIDLWVHLSNKFKIPEEERHLIKPSDRLKNKKKRQDCIKWRFFPFFSNGVLTIMQIQLSMHLVKTCYLSERAATKQWQRQSQEVMPRKIE